MKEPSRCPILVKLVIGSMCFADNFMVDKNILEFKCVSSKTTASPTNLLSIRPNDPLSKLDAGSLATNTNSAALFI